jgi:hypothetical protein
MQFDSTREIGFLDIRHRNFNGNVLIGPDRYVIQQVQSKNSIYEMELSTTAVYFKHHNLKSQHRKYNFQSLLFDSTDTI